MNFVEEGFYWYRDSDQHRWSILEVFKRPNGWWLATDINDQSTWNSVENYQGEWVGPISKPKE